MKTVCSIAGITLLAGWALYLGYDGVLYLTVVGILAGLGGYPVLNTLKEQIELNIAKKYLKEAK